MGQLEKYGLYVLCLVIFLILGVTIWGGGDAQPGNRSPAVPILAPGGSGQTAPPATQAAALSRSLEELLSSGAPTGQGGGGKSTGSNTGGKQGGTAEASAQLGGETAPGASPAGGGANDPSAKPPSNEPGRVAYRVQEKDTLESVARTKLGNAALWPEIQKLNPGLEPTKMRAGKEIWLPTGPALGSLDKAKTAAAPIAPVAAGSRTYTVKKGDNYERIAINELGSKKRTQELIDLNPGIDPTKLRPGHRLALPKK